ncbi:MAG: TIGR02996 domain-containing protein [Enhygromyxa sp.]
MPPSLTELRARPDDRELLLVYADWLASRGDPRGELIAVQDAEQHCASVEEFERMRARAVELVEAHAELRPELELLGPGPRRNLWALWRGGFIRRLDVLVDRPVPRPDAGLSGWAELIAKMLAHPSMALLEELLIRVDLRGEPLDETAAGLTIVVDALASWTEPLTLALWTYRPPRSDLRERLQSTLPGIRKLWYSTDITRIVPPRSSPITALEQAIGLERGRQFDWVWVDRRGNFSEQFVGADPSLAVHVRHIAERLRPPVLASTDQVPQRRIVGLVDQLAARFESARVAQPLAPRRLAEPRPERIDRATACERIGADAALAAALSGFAGLEWWWIEEQVGSLAWVGLCGLGSEQLLMLAAPPTSVGPA